MGRICQKLLFFSGDNAEPADRFQGAAHDSKRLFGTVFPFPEADHSFRIFRIAGKMDAADPLHGKDLSIPKELLREPEGILPINGAAVRNSAAAINSAAVRSSAAGDSCV